MQLLILALVIGIFLHDMQADSAVAMNGLPLAAVVLLPKFGLGFLYWLLCRMTMRRLARRSGRRWLGLIDRLSSVFRYLVLVFYGIDLSVGALVVLRTVIDTVMLDELVFMLPPLMLLVWSWWVYYPIDRRLREASLLSRIDAGMPIHPIWSRRQYLLAQLRHQVAIIFVPLLFILAWEEFVRKLGPQLLPGLTSNAQALLIVLGAGCFFLVAPVMIRHLWNTEPLAEGHLRQRLLAMCERYRVGCRELLLWRTFGGMINAAVMGVFRHVRYILLTDALIETLSAEQIEAVMAHELAHVRRQHLFWLLVIAVGTMGGMQLAWGSILQAIPEFGHESVVVAKLIDWLQSEQNLAMAATIGSILCWLLVFGWISRRFERQADTFAVQHLSKEVAAKEGFDRQEGGLVIQPHSAQIMTMALQLVAELNNIATDRRSWRHGSIAWRQAYLRRIVGQPLDSLAIDRQVGWIKIFGICCTMAVIGLLLGHAATDPTWD